MPGFANTHGKKHALNSSVDHTFNGNLQISGNITLVKNDPEFRLTDIGNSEYSRATRSNSSNALYMYNRVTEPASTAYSLNYGGASQADYTSIANRTGFPTGSSSFTLSCWVKFDSITVPNTYQIVFTYGATNNAFYLTNGLNSNKIYAEFWGAGKAQSTTIMVVGTWYHVVCTYNGTNIKIFINGTNEHTGSSITSALTNSFCVIGNETTTANRGFDGTIDETAFWTRVLTDDEITDLYASGAGMKIDPTSTFPSTGTSQSTNLVLLCHFDEGSGASVADDSGNGNTGTNNGTYTWSSGKVPNSGSNVESTVFSSIDGFDAGEDGIQTFGDNDGRTVLDGKTIRLNINSVEKANIDANGRLFVGGSSLATSLVHIAAGTSTASTSPFKLTAGINLSVPEAGAIEYDGGSLYFTPIATRQTVATTSNTLGDFSATTSAQLASVISNETGTGSLVFATSPGFTTSINPSSNDNASIGTTSLMWSDLFLASGAVINYNNGDVVLTHSPDALTLSGGSFISTGNVKIDGQLIVSGTSPTNTAINFYNDSLTTGSLFTISSNSVDGSTRSLTSIFNDNTGASGTTCLNIRQNANSPCLSIAGGSPLINFNTVNGVFDYNTSFYLGDSSSSYGFLRLAHTAADNYIQSTNATLTQSKNLVVGGYLAGTLGKLELIAGSIVFVDGVKINTLSDSTSTINFNKASTGASYMTLDSTNGRVGIWKTTPTQALDVSGAITSLSSIVANAGEANLDLNSTKKIGNNKNLIWLIFTTILLILCLITLHKFVHKKKK